MTTPDQRPEGSPQPLSGEAVTDAVTTREDRPESTPQPQSNTAVTAAMTGPDHQAARVTTTTRVHVKQPRWSRVDGVLLLDKPIGLSSNAALQRARRLLCAEHGGHTGTLDPMASGLLPLVFGDAAKFGQTLLDSDKTYVARVRLGTRTTTADAEGEVIEQCPVPPLDAAAIEAVLARFRGPIEQVPPMYSALKRDGVPLYRLARQGIAVDRAPRNVHIHELVLEAHRGQEQTPESRMLKSMAQGWQAQEGQAQEGQAQEGQASNELAAPDLLIRVRCSKGTYIRTLAEDLGAAIGCGAHLAALRRTQVGEFRIVQAMTLAALEALEPAARLACLLPVDAPIARLPQLQLDAVASARLAHGQSIAGAAPDGLSGPARAYSAQGRFLGLVDCTLGVVRPQRLVRSRDDAPG